MRARHAESGMAMMTALVTLLLVTVLGLSLTAVGMLSVTVASNDRDTNEALAIADAGLTHARALLLNQVWVTAPGSSGYTQLLALGDGAGCSGDEFSLVPAFASSPYPPVAELIPTAGRTFPTGNTFGGRYEVRLCDDHTVESNTPAYVANPAGFPGYDNDDVDVNRRLLVRSRGIGRNGAEATIEATFNDRALPALVVDGNLVINGNVEIMGAAGAVHANGNLDLKGTTMCVEQYYSSVGHPISGTGDGGPTCTANGAPMESGADPMPVPKLDPADPMFQTVADYLLISAEKKVKCGPSNTTGACAGSDPLNPTVLATLNNNGDKWKGWSYQKFEWSATGDDVPKGTYWTDGNITIGSVKEADAAECTAIGKTPPCAKSVTLFARGWINITGNAKLRPDAAIGIQVYAVVAGTDLQIAGTVGVDTYEGLYYARDQINFVGTPDISGNVIARNFQDVPWPAAGVQGSENKVPLVGGYVSVSGNVKITYNGNSGWNALRIASWRECRGADPNNPCGNP